MRADTKAANDPAACTWLVGGIICGRRAIIAIERGVFGQRRVCRVHMDEPGVYVDVEEHGWPWRLLVDTPDPDKETPPG